MVLVNLMANAVKFTSQRAAAKIEIGGAPGADHEVVFFIRDNGAGSICGMPTDYSACFNA